MIKGIDSQIITSRTTDLMKESSNQLKSNQFAQTFNSKLNDKNVDKNTKTVTDINKNENRKVGDQESKKDKKEEKKNKKNKIVTDDFSLELGEDVLYSGNENVGYTAKGVLDIEI